MCYPFLFVSSVRPCRFSRPITIPGDEFCHYAVSKYGVVVQFCHYAVSKYGVVVQFCHYAVSKYGVVVQFCHYAVSKYGVVVLLSREI